MRKWVGAIKKNRIQELMGILNRNWIIAIGLLCAIYVWASIVSAYLYGVDILVDPGSSGWIGVALGACVAALMFCVLLVCGSDARLTILEVVLPLISGTSMVAVRFLGDWSGGIPTLLSNMPLGFTTAALLILAFVALRREYANGQLGLNGILEIAAMLLVYFIAVVLVWPYLTDIVSHNINLTMWLIFVCGVAVWTALQLQRLSASNPAVSEVDALLSATDIADSDDQHLTQRCSTLAREHNLTPRELEVLLLLAQGRRSSYISEKLCVSSGTTKTHIKRIYQKCQIHSHEQLIDLVIANNR